jgi:signal peptidase II
MILYIIIMVLTVAADQLTKWAVVTHLPAEGDSYALWPNVLHFTRVNNTGAAFGSLQNSRWIFMVISALAIVLMLVYLFRAKPANRWIGTSLSLVIGGGIANMIDRVFLGYVIDFIDFRALPKLWKWVFNVADACVVVGCFLLLAILLFVEFPKERKAAKEETEKAAKAGKDHG